MEANQHLVMKVKVAENSVILSQKCVFAAKKDNPGLHQAKYFQQAEREFPFPLLSTDKATPGMLDPVQGSQVQDILGGFQYRATVLGSIGGSLR